MPATNGKLPAPKHSVRRSPNKGSSRIWVGDCRKLLPKLAKGLTNDKGKPRKVDLVFADPPFNWARAYDEWHDKMPEAEYLDFTYEWIDLCHAMLSDHGAFWINIPDDWAAEIVLHCKNTLGLHMINWCVWHYRFGQNTNGRFINSKVHALYFAKDRDNRTWNSEPILEISDRRSTYGDPRTEAKRDGMPSGRRVPMDVWYGKYWGRVQGNNKERRGYHDNQLPEVYLERVILACSNEGDLVLDPFTGSGTTGVVAREHNRDYIGTEFSAANAKSAHERIKAGMVRKDALKDAVTAIHAPRRPHLRVGAKT